MLCLPYPTPSKTRNLLRRSTAMTSVFLVGFALPAVAQDDGCSDVLMPQPAGCERANSDVVVQMPTGANTELVTSAPGGDFGAQGFSISIDGDTVAGAPAPRGARRTADLSNAARDIDLRYDGLDMRRLLNVSTDDLRASYRAGEGVTFRASANYPAYIKRAELRIIDRSARGRPVVATVPISPNGTANWVMPENGTGELAYVLRVYDGKGRYDETQPLELNRTDRAFETHSTVRGDIIAAGEGEDRTRIRNIPTGSGGITTTGTVAPGSTVRILGENIPVDASGRFVSSRILPAGTYTVPVQITRNGRTETIIRDVEIPHREIFGVGLIDLTFGKRLKDDLASANPDYDSTYSEGRIAGYVTGKTERGYRYSLSADTGNGPLDEIFQRLDEKDPRRVIQRMDPDDVYPTYGDDSSAYDDAPTSGRIYARVERNNTRLTWGDFKAGITGTDLLSSTRALYGLEVRHQSQNVTTDGDARLAVTAYVASPDTLPQRDILRGTGGSIYFLSRQDINGGSETVAIQVVDPVTNRVISNQQLTEGVDYRIDYIQGVILLNNPLSSSTSGPSLISSGNVGSYDVNLVSQYEYTPTIGSLDGASIGGRVEVWATDHLRFGTTVMSENTGIADQEMRSVDLRYELGEHSYVEFEVAETEGPGFGRTLSSDGGLTLTNSGPVAAGRARAYRFDAAFDFEELGFTMPGTLGLYYDHKKNGFSTLAENITEDQTLWGLNAKFDVSSDLSIGIDYEDFDKAGGDKRTTAEIRFAYQIDDTLSVEAALAHLDQFEAGNALNSGSRTDVALRLNYQDNPDRLYYVYGQGTVDRSGGVAANNRIGVGFDGRLSEKLALAAEASDGSGGFGAKVKLSYSPTADNEVYLGYTLDPTRTGFNNSSLLGSAATEEITIGSRYKLSETVSVYGENNWDIFGDRQSLTRAYGVKYTPNAQWTYSGGIESGRVRDSVAGNFDRDAISFGLAYAYEDLQDARIRLEYRTEDGVGIAQDRDTWALTASYSHKVNPDWRLLFNLDALISDSDQSSFRDGEYIEASLGYAYRPIDNERLNMLFRYSYLHDLPGADQVTVTGNTNGAQQRSHVLSVDAIYDLTPKLSIGGKYGYRVAKTAPRGTNAFVDNAAHLGVIRFDWHVVHKWDVLAEGRILKSTDTNVTETGAVLGVYRHFGNNAKVGIGYEWGEVSDDLTNIDYEGQGIFLNLIAKF